jgi:hypothetical protein
MELDLNMLQKLKLLTRCRDLIENIEVRRNEQAVKVNKAVNV